MTGRKDIYAVHIHGLPDSTWRQNSKVGKKFTTIDKTIVENAAQHFDGAREFLKAIK